jgi:hypothetical protein
MSIADGNYDQAISDLQTGYVLGHYIGEGPTLIHCLVGVAIGRLMNEQVEFLVSQPESPNLYWALADLPDPYVNTRRAFRFEWSILYLSYPQLQDLTRRKLSPPECEELIVEFFKAKQVISGDEDAKPDWQERLQLAAMAAAIYPKAKPYVIERYGISPEEADDWPVQQISLIYSLDRFAHWRDNMFKWFAIPYWQARKGTAQAERDLEKIHGDIHEGGPFTALLPSLARAQFLFGTLPRQTGALRCIEAIRMQAAKDGRWPGSVDEITVVPLPIDPITGEPYRINFEDDTITIDMPAPEPNRPRDGTRYEITLGN